MFTCICAVRLLVTAQWDWPVEAPAHPRSRLEHCTGNKFWNSDLILVFFSFLQVLKEIKAWQRDTGKIHYLFLCALNPDINILLSICCLCSSDNKFIVVPRTFQDHSLLRCLPWFLYVPPGWAQMPFLLRDLSEHPIWNNSPLHHFLSHLPYLSFLSIYFYIFLFFTSFLSFYTPPSPARM